MEIGTVLEVRKFYIKFTEKKFIIRNSKVYLKQTLLTWKKQNTISQVGASEVTPIKKSPYYLRIKTVANAPHTKFKNLIKLANKK